MTEIALQPGVDAEDPAVVVALSRARTIRAGLTRWATLVKDITDAYNERDWHTLGYAGWHPYVDEQFGGQLPQFEDADQRYMVMLNMSETGMSQRAIATATGESQSTVSRTLAAGDSNASPAITAADSAGPFGAPLGTPDTDPLPTRHPVAPVTTGTDGRTYPRPAPVPVLPPVFPEILGNGSAYNKVRRLAIRLPVIERAMLCSVLMENSEVAELVALDSAA